jgi:hypothetical protein
MATDPMIEAKTLGFEPRDVSTRGLVYFLLIVAVFLALTCLGLQALFAHYTKADIPKAVVQPLFDDVRPLPPPPRLQTTPRADLQDYLQSEQRLLESSGWIDQKNGVARIPIDRAMVVLLQKGLPTQSQNPAGTNDSNGQLRRSAITESSKQKGKNETPQR